MDMCLVAHELTNSRIRVRLTVQGSSLPEGTDEIVGLHPGDGSGGLRSTKSSWLRCLVIGLNVNRRRAQFVCGRWDEVPARRLSRDIMNLASI